MSWPRSLFARVMLVLVAGLTLAQLITLALVLGERGMVMRGMMVSYLAADVASSIAILDRVPVDERAAWLPRLQRANYHLALGQVAAPVAADTEFNQSLRRAVSEALSQPVTAVRSTEPAVEVRLDARLKDGAVVSVELAQPRLRLSGWLLGALLAQLALLAACCWIAVRQVTSPLARLASASETLEPSRAPQSLPETGPIEVAHASAAFNRMQQRIEAQLEERSQMLGAISHDLQTPITRMRLRAEMLSDSTLRKKLHADLAQMQHLVEQGLAYARTAQADREPEAMVDVTALLQSMLADYQDAGQAVRWRGGVPVRALTRPNALRRVLGNLIDNAIKFGGKAEIGLETEVGVTTIVVADRGPGIAPGELDKVVRPFYRVEHSRNRATGGTGLGLAIVQRLAAHCHAEVAYGAREGGGLQVRVKLTRLEGAAAHAARTDRD